MAKFKLLRCSILIILVSIIMDSSFASAEHYQIWEEKNNVDPNHNWTITFNEEIDASMITNENIYIKYNDEVLEDINLSIGKDKRTIKVEAPQIGYKERETYFLYVEKTVASAKNEQLNMPIEMKFTTGESNLASKLLIKVRGTESFDEIRALFDQRPYITTIENETGVKHTVSDELNAEIYDLFSTKAHFSYGFYLGRLSDLMYTFNPNEQMFSSLKDELTSILGEPYKDKYASEYEYFIEWRRGEKTTKYSYSARVILHLSDNRLTLTQVTL